MKKIIKCGQLFTAEDESVQHNMCIVIEDNIIIDVIKENLCKDEGEVIDLTDKFIMPGLIDAHVHVCLDGSPTIDPMYHKLPEEVTISAMLEAKKDLMAGFTTIRDEGGVNFSDIAVKKAIDNKLIKGPRMFVSGPALTSIGGHGDSHFSPQILNASLGIVVNGADEARNAARLNLKYGADQIKLFATGGVMSFGDEPGAAELTFDEMKAALEIANLRGRISSAHAHGAEGIKNAIKAGVTSIEHGMLIDEEAMEMMVEHGVYLIPTIIAAERIIEFWKKGALPKWMAEKVSVPVAIHLDHGDTFEHCVEMLNYGFTSIMYDGSKYSLEENIRRTNEVIKVVHAIDIPVEAEIGELARLDDNGNITECSNIADVDNVKKYLESCHPDSLAIGIGNAHGFYKGPVDIKVDILRQCREFTDIPFVLHGCTGMDEETVKKSIEYGVAKINFGTQIRYQYVDYVRQGLEEKVDQGHAWRLSRYASDKLKDDVKKLILLAGSENKA